MGLDGVGKAQIVFEAACGVRDAYINCSFFWVPLVNNTTFENAFSQIGRCLRLPVTDDDETDVNTLVKEALSQDSAGEWLLILDHADDLELLFNSPAFFKYLHLAKVATSNHDMELSEVIPSTLILTTLEMSTVKSTYL